LESNVVEPALEPGLHCTSGPGVKARRMQRKKQEAHAGKSQQVPIIDMLVSDLGKYKLLSMVFREWSMYMDSSSGSGGEVY